MSGVDLISSRLARDGRAGLPGHHGGHHETPCFHHARLRASPRGKRFALIVDPPGCGANDKADLACS